ncbi:MAG TPA: hypothetical protein VM032_13505 [Vicinamibacterales bacterium]|nr:hypothetical protein [Vicinamibacterales bacterium]
MKERAKNPEGYPIDHNEMRFRNIIEVPAIPHAGDLLQLTTRSGRVLPATIVRVDLDEPRQLFVVSAQYGQRTISIDDYSALAQDPDWQLKHLLEP